MGYKNRERQRAYQKKWHEKNKVRIRESRWQRRKAWIDAMKSRPCTDCHREYPSYVMQFDHVRGKKLSDVSHLMRTKGIATVRTEIDKCDLVCANCHAVRTYQRKMGTGRKK